MRNELDEAFRESRPAMKDPDARVVVCEGMWDNPNHWFRLHVFVKALERVGGCRLLAVLRSRKDDRLQRETLRSLGVETFVYLDDDASLKRRADAEARTMLRKVRTHEDLLRLDLPAGLPAYVFYDTALKVARSPQPPLDSPVWFDALSGAIRDLRRYENLLASQDVAAVVSSHPWKNEWATLCWAALGRNVPFHYLTGYGDSIRIRLMTSTEEYSRPLEHLTRAEFDSLSAAARVQLARRGEDYLRERYARMSSDINVRYAFVPERRAVDRDQARRLLGVDSGRPLAVIFGSVWFDFPHYFGMRNFTDFLDWIHFTLDTVKFDTGVTWALRPHPVERWYGGPRLADVVRSDYPNVIVLDREDDSLTTQLAADVIVTVHGTVAVEAAARGARTLCADRSYYSGWGFTTIAATREDYAYKLRHVMELAVPSSLERDQALAFAATTLGPPPSSLRYLPLQDDSFQERLYPQLLDTLRHGRADIEHEASQIGEWIASEHHSYNVNRIVQSLSPAASPAVRA